MQAQTASEQGLAPESIFTKLSGLAVGSEVIVTEVPTFTEHEEYGVQASLQTTKGIVQTNNRKTVGGLQSEDEDSLGGKIRASIANGKALILFVKEETASTGRKQKVLSIYR